MDASFRKVLESHQEVPTLTAMASIKDSSFRLVGTPLDAPFCEEMLGLLSPRMKAQRTSSKDAPPPFAQVQRTLTSAMKAFLAPQQRNPVAHRAVVTASLSLLRNACAVAIPSKLSLAAAHAVLQTLTRSNKNANVNVELGGDGFPESQMAAFLLDATLAQPPLPTPAPPMDVPPQLAVKIINVFGVGKARADALEWGTSVVANSLRDSVRRIARKLRDEADWKVMAQLVGHMGSASGVEEAERVLGMSLSEMIASAMLSERWQPAHALLSCAPAGESRQALARALIPAATDAEAYDVAAELIEENELENEFPTFDQLRRKSHVMRKKAKLEAVVGKTGWKMAQTMLERGSRDEEELRLWLVDHMRDLGNLPAAAALRENFRLQRVLPPFDPELVEASARQRAKAHLRLPISASAVVVVDDLGRMRDAQRALAEPPAVGGKSDLRRVRCVGLDVENAPQSGKASLFQVATSTKVFLFDLDAICSSSMGNERGRRRARAVRDERNEARMHQAHPQPQQPRDQSEEELLELFDNVVSSLLADPDVVKLGFAFDSDVAHLRRRCPTVRGFRKVEALLEIGSLSEAVLGREVGSLSKNCAVWLGKPLDKTECTSRWETRPLTSDQLRYAALDAHCLIGIFEEMLIEEGGQLAGTGGNDEHGWWAARLKSNSAPEEQ